ncbi:helix-turn-helix transcriptional regulator [Pandoraea pnomenusa]|uniref:helix-turn-helix transcriptional regulator n=1 Tax=Pandoraea pnomenusa TaxID=93220 RepID=UPI001AC0251A|nr:AlpA family phage regulatory protein [Pandoraea pnomenusa]MBN9093920.1 AlpA family phage regulatory protein [Pandoraea pnomenusa]
MKALSVKQVAAKLSLSRTTIYRMVAAGKLPKPFILYGNRTAWLEEDIDAWLAKPAGKTVPSPAASKANLDRSPSADKPPIDIEALLSRLDALIALLSHPQSDLKDRLWSAEEIAGWMLLSASTVKQRVISQPGFPRPFQPGGLEHSQSRWFAGEVIRWAHEHRGKLPLRRSKGSQTPI